MNDKQQLAAMGAEMAGQQSPMCMAKKIEQLQEQLEVATMQRSVMADLLRELRDSIEGEWCVPDDLDERIGDAMAGKLPERYAPAGWKLVPVEPTVYQVLAGRNAKQADDELCVSTYRAMLAAAPKLEDRL